MANAWSGSGLPGPDAKPELPQISKEIREEAQEKEPGSKDVPLQQTSTARYQGSQGTKGLLALGTLASSFQYANSNAIADGSIPIKINDTEALGKICRDLELCGKKYQLTEDIDGSQFNQSIGTKTNPFTGELDGNGHTIGNLFRCLVEHHKGSIYNLTLSDANITESTDSAGVVACEMSGNAKISNIRVERAYVATKKSGAYAAIGAGSLSGGTVNNIMAVNCSVETEGKGSSAGIGVGYQKKGTTVTDTTALDCTVKTYEADAGIGAGSSQEGTVNNTMAVNCRVTTEGKDAPAGIGAGLSQEGTVNNTMAVDCDVTTEGVDAPAGIGAGLSVGGTVNITMAVDCDVNTNGDYAGAGIGAGLSESGTVANTTAVNCDVITVGEASSAGIGVGDSSEKNRITNTKVFNSNVNATDGSAAISGGENSRICNVTVVNVGLKRTESTPKGCQYWQNKDVCADIAPNLAKLKRQIDKYCPDTSITGTMATTPGSTMDFSSSGSVTTTTPPTTVAKTPGSTMDFSSPGSVTMTTPPATGAKVPKMNFSDPDFATFAAPKPLVASPTPAVIACIATLGTVIFLLVGVIAYRYCSQRSSTNAGRNRTEPMPPPPSGPPRAQGQLPTAPGDHYQPLSFRPMNKRPLPALPIHYQPLKLRQGKTATGYTSPLVGNEKEPAPPDIPVYLELIGDESINNHGEPVADGQAGIATGSNSMANTGNPIRPDSPVYHVLTEYRTNSDDNRGEPVANTGNPIRPGSPVYHVLTENGTDSDDNRGEPVANTGNPIRPGSPVYHVLTENGTDSDDNRGEPVA
ncbi:hypothetical protein J7438_25120, partial [Thalassotalea sp. G20_0]|uniref:ZmpA/ZmpB/ZmpC family metallo-endopeptidase-related protein n=1 Tax=Thalassotalea sp. G20_0 TaxID=2821093 RepID=UPI001ADCAA10